MVLNSFWLKYKAADYFSRRDLLKTLPMNRQANRIVWLMIILHAVELAFIIMLMFRGGF